MLSWLGRQDESMRGQLTGHAYSSAKEKREKRGARDSKRNDLSPGATCLAICITLQILQNGSQYLWDESRRRGKKKIVSDVQRREKRKMEGSNYFIRLISVAVNKSFA